MEQITEGTAFPAWLQRILSLALTVLAVVLYMVVLGSAIYRTAVETDPVFNDGIAQAAALLSGLVGSVVAAGFARSRRPSSVSVRLAHPLAGRPSTAWSTLTPPSLLRAKLTSLARTLGLLPLHGPAPRNTAEEGQPSIPAAPETPETPAEPTEPGSTALWIAALYFGAYFLVGLAALIVTLIKPTVPDMIESAAWVWLGTVISSAYTFFGLDARV